MKQNLEKLAADAILNEGISLPLRFRRRTVRVTVKIPTTRDLIRISRMYGETGLKYDEIRQYSFDQKAEMISRHGKAISRMVAYGIVRLHFLGWLGVTLVAWILRRHMNAVAMVEAWEMMLTTINTCPFARIIASAEAINLMEPMTMTSP